MRMYWRRLCALVIVVLVAGMIGASTQAASAFASPAFQTQWQAGEAVTPNFWGPLETAKDGQQESYKEAPGGKRTAQYFDKARMEQFDPNARVTTGLLTVELKSGKLQLGDTTFEQRAPARINVAGDPGTNGLTYADLSTFAEYYDPTSANTYSAYISGDNHQFTPLTADNANPYAAQFDTPTGNTFTYVADPTNHYGQVVYSPFQDFIKRLTDAGIAIDQTPGYPISPVVIATVPIGGKATTVFVQAFERRVLTYNPNNDPAFRVEFGNIGQQYYAWRYGTSASAPVASAPTTAPTTVPAPMVSASTPVPATPPAVTPATSGVTFTSVQGAKPGNVATVMVQTAPNASCSIGYVTPKGTQSEAAGLVTKTAGADGDVSWSWLIGGATKPGTGSVTVTCNGVNATTNITIG